MSTRTHVAEARRINVVSLAPGERGQEQLEILGVDDVKSHALVLEDPFNQEALVITGDRAGLLELAEHILASLAEPRGER